MTLTAVSANDPSCDLYMLTETLERYATLSKSSRREAEAEEHAARTEDPTVA